MNERIGEILSMLFKCLDWSSDR